MPSHQLPYGLICQQMHSHSEKIGTGFKVLLAEVQIGMNAAYLLLKSRLYIYICITNFKASGIPLQPVQSYLAMAMRLAWVIIFEVAALLRAHFGM